MTEPNGRNAEVERKSSRHLSTDHKPTAVKSRLRTPPLLPHGDRCPTFATQKCGLANLWIIQGKKHKNLFTHHWKEATSRLQHCHCLMVQDNSIEHLWLQENVKHEITVHFPKMTWLLTLCIACVGTQTMYALLYVAISRHFILNLIENCLSALSCIDLREKLT